MARAVVSSFPADTPSAGCNGAKCSLALKRRLICRWIFTSNYPLSTTGNHSWTSREPLRADEEDEGIKERVNPSSPYGPGVNGWENQTTEAFLDAAIRWAESTSFGETQELPPTNPWAEFAAFLYCGKIYE